MIFDPKRARETAKRLRSRARAQPLFVGETVKRGGDLVIFAHRTVLIPHQDSSNER